MKLHALILSSSLAWTASGAAERLVMHEWGTFTSLQDEAGRTLDGINSEDEPLPKFTHDIDHLLVLKNNLPPFFYQGAPQSLPRVTMRLETPVIYFHRAAPSAEPLVVDLEVAFRGGWLTQYYPDAKVEAPGAFASLTPATTGRLSWHGLKVGAAKRGPKTTEHVWTAPRAVDAATVETTNGECEKFLFYRGVGNVEAPLRVVRDETNHQLSVFSQPGSRPETRPPLPIHHLWLASLRPQGVVAFRKLEAITLGHAATSALLVTPATFRELDYSQAGLNQLRSQMRAALIDEGLFRDEAEALLNTWELSYFKSTGLRLFFLVPRGWTDDCLPLDLSVPAEIKRVMVGRIELVTPEQRDLLRQLASGPAPRQPWAHREMVDGKPVLKGTMPPAYRDLGRFRNALLLDALHHAAPEPLKMFALINGLDNYRVEEP